jgi:DNA-binding XRE family transcriptional regulator
MLTYEQLCSVALGVPGRQSRIRKNSGRVRVMDESTKARAAQGLTQPQIAEQIGAPQSAVARTESDKGKHSQSLATLTECADALECRLIRKS